MHSPWTTNIAAGAALLAVAILGWQFLPNSAAMAPLDPPAVLQERLTNAASPAEKVRAAHDFIRHGEAARVEVRAAVADYARHEPEVVAPLLQATMKNRDYRSLPTLVELLEHPDPLVRGRAGAAVQKILGADFGFRANDSPESRAKIVEIIRQDYAVAQPRLQELYSDQRE